MLEKNKLYFSSLSDEKLLHAVLKNDFSALKELILRYQQRLLNFFYRMTGSETRAAELFLETFTYFYQTRFSNSPGLRVSFILFSAAWRKARIFLEQNPLSTEINLNENLISNYSPHSFESRDLKFQQTLLNLNLKERACLALCFLEGLAYTQTAAILNESEESVRQKTSQALNALAQELKEDFFKNGL
jgi:RNA polymerase sigma-70 factor, ECF subfamily